jgi:lysozyme
MTQIPFLPPNRPRKRRAEVEAMAQAAGITAPVYLVAIRGYYHDDHNDNARGLYDDAMFLVTPQSFVAFNANTDPSVFRPGIAALKPGLWSYRLGIHGLSKPKARQYVALVQAGEVTVHRDGKGDDTGWFGINIHRGAVASTSSLGCQTIPPSQWDSFIALVKRSLSEHDQKVIPYLLTV